MSLTKQEPEFARAHEYLYKSCYSDSSDTHNTSTAIREYTYTIYEETVKHTYVMNEKSKRRTNNTQKYCGEEDVSKRKASTIFPETNNPNHHLLSLSGRPVGPHAGDAGTRTDGCDGMGTL